VIETWRWDYSRGKTKEIAARIKSKLARKAVGHKGRYNAGTHQSAVVPKRG
jgi:hypothetical protein